MDTDYLIAGVGDLTGMIPVVNFFADGLTMITFAVAGSKDLDIYGDKQIVGTLVAGGIKFVPFASFFPAWTTRVVLAKQRQKREQAKPTIH